MQTKAILVCLCLLFLYSRSSGTKPRPPRDFCARIPASAPAANGDLSLLLENATKLRQQSRYLEAAHIYSEAYRKAMDRNERQSAARCLNNLGGCWFHSQEYWKALHAYLESRSLAEALGNWERAGQESINISSLYSELGDSASAKQAAERGLRDMELVPAPKYRAQLLLVLATLSASEHSEEIFYRAIDEADRQGDTALEAHGWHLLGCRMREAGRLAEAEQALDQAFRLRLLTHDPNLDHTYSMLVLLRLEQGDLNSASHLAAVAVETNRTPFWGMYFVRGRARMAAGNYAAALDDFRAALDLARRMRLDAVPADSVRVGTDVKLSKLYSGFIQAAAGLFFQAKRTSLAAEAFAAAEENRAASLRASLLESHDWRKNLPAEYGEDLARLRATEVALLRNPRPEQERLAGRMRAELTEMEARAGLGFAQNASDDDGVRGHLYERVRARLDCSEALLSFHLAEPESYLWVVTNDGIEMHRLPGAAALAGAIHEFSNQVRSGSPSAARSGGELYRQLFGALSPRLFGRHNWILALEGALFQLPFAALVAGQANGHTAYLIEEHSLRIVPSAALLVATGPDRPAYSARFVGVGDPVFNTADPRWHGWFWQRSEGIPLGRLAGSAREIRSCAQIWAAARS